MADRTDKECPVDMQQRMADSLAVGDSKSAAKAFMSCYHEITNPKNHSQDAVALQKEINEDLVSTVNRVNSKLNATSLCSLQLWDVNGEYTIGSWCPSLDQHK